jgi:hypothetical protein
MIKGAGRFNLGRLAVAGLLATSWALAAEPGPGRALERYALLQKVLLETAAQVSVKEQAAAFRQQAEREFSKDDGCAVEPAGPALTPAAVETKVKDELASVARRLYPDPDAAALERAAAAAFPLVKKGETVSITYQYNPGRKSSATGIFYGINGGAALVGSHRILLRDLRPPPEGEACFARFDAGLTTERRRAFVTVRQTAVTEARAAWMAREQAVRLDAAQREAVTANERQGYVWLGGEWKTIQTAVAERTQVESPLLRDLWERAHPVVVQTVPVAVKPVAAPVPPPPVVLPVQPPAVSVAVPPAVAPVVKPAAPVVKPVVPQAASAARPVVPALVAAPPPVTPVARETHAGPPPARRWWVWALMPLVLGVGGWLALRQMRELQRRGWRHDNRDAAETGFWEPARKAAWPHVAYSFPDYESARRAVGQLSFIDVATTGELRSREGVHFGIYELENQFVAFVGGAAMSFLMWRECMAVFGRGNGAASFQVSEAPGLNLELPNPAHLSGPAAQVFFDRDYDGDGDDYRHYVLFKGPGEAGARAFLRRLAEPPPGIYLVVETPAGQWGRDADGYYKE